jgi:hypothetical protein
MKEKGVSGRSYSVAEGTERGAAMWRPYVGPSRERAAGG